MTNISASPLARQCDRSREPSVTRPVQISSPGIAATVSLRVGDRVHVDHRFLVLEQHGGASRLSVGDHGARMIGSKDLSTVPVAQGLPASALAARKALPALDDVAMRSRKRPSPRLELLVHVVFRGAVAGPRRLPLPLLRRAVGSATPRQCRDCFKHVSTRTHASLEAAVWQLHQRADDPRCGQPAFHSA